MENDNEQRDGPLLIIYECLDIVNSQFSKSRTP